MSSLFTETIERRRLRFNARRILGDGHEKLHQTKCVVLQPLKHFNYLKKLDVSCPAALPLWYVSESSLYMPFTRSISFRQCSRLPSS